MIPSVNIFGFSFEEVRKFYSLKSQSIFHSLFSISFFLLKRISRLPISKWKMKNGK